MKPFDTHGMAFEPLSVGFLPEVALRLQRLTGFYFPEDYAATRRAPAFAF
jgi:hypothetical protein